MERWGREKRERGIGEKVGGTEVLKTETETETRAINDDSERGWEEEKQNQRDNSSETAGLLK